ncbi:hypothetical protein L226DRAFT_523599 [Lentinus tigrinus ALCF2SS1-7]|uniref:uncharacterized protein n=1 Tax=Lentinus tigrinus ALCF2SS1-7 TaxID=1328758 RepID=UPI001165D88A|nr:hypothetical protein L226DRAFT_523599 [Lentinus tigrinus ALCF2SS1-7]
METSRWTLRKSIFPVDMLAWGPSISDQYAHKGALYICLTGTADDDVVVFEQNKLEAFMERRRVSDHTVTFRGANAGLSFTFTHRDAAEEFICVKGSSATICDEVPCLGVLRQLGIIGEEDITSAYQRSFVSDKPLQTCNFLFDDRGLMLADDLIALVDRTPPPDRELDLNSDSEDWSEGKSDDAYGLLDWSESMSDDGLVDSEPDEG